MPKKKVTEEYTYSIPEDASMSLKSGAVIIRPFFCPGDIVLIEPKSSEQDLLVVSVSGIAYSQEHKTWITEISLSGSGGTPFAKPVRMDDDSLRESAHILFLHRPNSDLVNKMCREKL